MAPPRTGADVCFRAEGALWPPLALGDGQGPGATCWLVLTTRTEAPFTGAAELRHPTRRSFTGRWASQAHDTLLVELTDGFSHHTLWLLAGPSGVTGHGRTTTDDVEGGSVEWRATARRVPCDAVPVGPTRW